MWVRDQVQSVTMKSWASHLAAEPEFFQFYKMWTIPNRIGVKIS